MSLTKHKKQTGNKRTKNNLEAEAKRLAFGLAEKLEKNEISLMQMAEHIDKFLSRQQKQQNGNV